MILWLSCFVFSALLAQAEVDFARDVHPLLVSRCTACHGTAKPQGGLALNTREEMLRGGVSGPSIVPGKSAESLLIQRITGAKKPLMPMGGPALTPEEIDNLRAWIDAGAKAAEKPLVSGWKPRLEPRRPNLPAGYTGNGVDYFLDAYRRKHNLPGIALVSDDVFARRAYLDLWGLLPVPSQRASFLKAQGTDKRGELVGTLLADRQNYAEHWISFWNDLLHNDEGVTYIGDRKSISKWLLNALSTNMPYHRMVTTLIDPPDEGSEGFVTGVNWRGDINASQTPVMQAAQNSAQVFLGVNLKCNSCHDSFISSWKLKDAYGLASFFSQQPLEIARCDAKTGEISSPAFLYPELGGIPQSAALPERRRAAAELFTKPENGRFARTAVNRIWQRLMGRGLVEPADDMDAEPWDADLLDWLASDFADHGYDLHHLLTQIMTSRAYQLPAVPAKERREKFVFTGPLYRRLTAEQFADAVSSVSSEWRVLQSAKPEPGVYAREWRFKSSPLARALGRPTRDLSVTERFNDPTMLQMLELVNGQTMANVVRRGSLRLLGKLAAAPAPLLDSGVVNSGKVNVDVDLTGARELKLIINDYDSYDPSRVVAGWASAVVEGPDGPVALASLQAKTAVRTGFLQLKGDAKRDAVLASVPSEIVYDLTGRGYKRLRATAGIDITTLGSDINPRVRFYVFTAEPDRAQMGAVAGKTPVPIGAIEPTREELISRVFFHALGRPATPSERTIAADMLQSHKGSQPSADGLEDLLWSIFLTPEFQYIR